MISTLTSTTARYRWLPTPTNRPFFQAAIAAAGLLLLASSPVCSQQATDSPPAAAPKQDKPQGSTPPQTRRESLLDLPELSDRVIELAVEDELLRSSAVDGKLINVDVADGVVTLSGRLNNILAEQIAVGLAERIRGVESVVDEIEIIVNRRDNAELKKDVLAAFQADPNTHKLHVDVVAADGTVTLSGTVPSYGLKVLAGEVAMGTKGVAELKNDLLVDSKKRLTDTELQKEIRELYRFAALLDDVHLEVGVKDATVVLNGTVASSFQKSYAEDLAWRAGAKDVDVRGVDVNWRHTNPLLRSQRYENVTDEEIRTAVQRAFQHDPRVLSFDPEIQVDHGVVTLTGEVSDLTANAAAERDARQTIGVRRVKNNLRTRWPDQPPTDEQIADFTRQALRAIRTSRSTTLSSSAKTLTSACTDTSIPSLKRNTRSGRPVVKRESFMSTTISPCARTGCRRATRSFRRTSTTSSRMPLSTRTTR